MEPRAKSAENLPDPQFFDNVRATIEKELEKMRKIVNNINQMRVEATYLESDLFLTIDAATWEDISELIGPTHMRIDDLIVKKETS